MLVSTILTDFKTCFVVLGQKKVLLFLEIGEWTFFYHSLARIVECVSEYIFFIKKKEKIKDNNKNNKKTKSKETKEEKIIYVENLTRYDDIVCESALCTFNLFNRVVSFSWLFIWF